MIPTRRRRPAASIAVGLLAGMALFFGAPVVAGPAAPVVDAAGPSLTMTGAATYEVRPASRLVHVTVQLAVTNHLGDSVIARHTFTRTDVAVPPTAKNATATAASKKVSVSIVSRTKVQQVLSVGLGVALGSGRTTSVTLAFDLPDPGGAASRPIRVGPSLVTFPVWAFGSAGLAGSSVVVRFPAGYDVRVVSGPLGPPVTAVSGTISLTSAAIPDPLAFNATVAADKPSSFVETKVDLDINAQPLSVIVRAWPDDPAWGLRMTKLVRSALPLLATEIGLPYQPSTPVIAIEEALPRTIDGYAATYEPDTGTIQVAYTADSTIAIHELAHLWFDGSLFADRWIDDGFAIFYGNRVATALKLKPRDESITPSLAAAALPLNTWSGDDALAGPIGTPSGNAVPTSGLADLYGRAAAVTLAGRLYDLVGADGLRDVWRAASGREAAYQPPGQLAQPLVSDGPPDWRGLLDLIVERTGKDASALWASVVVTPSEQAFLATRTATRREYTLLVARAAGWSIPQPVLDGLNAWQFGSATNVMTGLDQLLDQRDQIVTAADAAGLLAPTALQADFEQGAIGTGATEASNELQVLQAIQTAAAAEPEHPSVVDQVGLIGVDPAGNIAAAGTAFTAGDMATARAQALAADQAWSDASSAGGFRIRIAIASLLVAGVLLGFVVVQLRRIGQLGRRVRRPSRAQSARRVDPLRYPVRYPARDSRGTLADQPVRMARRVRPGPGEGDKSR